MTRKLLLIGRLVAACLLASPPFAAVAQATSPPPTAAPAAKAGTGVRINGAVLDEAAARALRQLEVVIGTVPPGEYWYDVRTGAVGAWGGPLVAFVTPGLPLGPAMPAGASGGGAGQLTGVFVNGRELHSVDVQRLLPVVQVQRGRYWWDAQGNVGTENGPWLFNIWWLVQQRAQAEGKPFHHRGDASKGKSTYVGKGCAAVSGRLRSSDHDSGYSYYVGC